MQSIIFLLLLNSAIYFAVADIDDQLLVTLPDGQIRGHILNSFNNKPYYAFQEIPYAAPPVGDLRFQPPVSPEKWDGVLNTTQNTKVCIQMGGFPGPKASGETETEESEDCLYLNVYTPVERNASDLLPVMVWVHGGKFILGSGTPAMSDPQYFMDYDIVVVAMNYRLGPFGFLTTEDNVIPGNLGLRDQNLAFQWVKENIDLFGGDPEKISIAGESAGGASVGLQLISKKNKGLFRGAILQSGSATITRMSHQDYARFYAFELGKSLDPNFTSDSSEDLLDLLKKAPVSDIVNNNLVVDPGKEVDVIEGIGSIWLPVIENEDLEDVFITGPHQENIKHGNINQVPILIGYNSEEELLSFIMDDEYPEPETLAAYFDNDLSNLVKYKFNMTQANKLTAGQKFREIYTDGLFQDSVGNVVRFMSDQAFTTPIIRHAKLQSNYTDVYLYQFSYKGELGGSVDLEIAGVRGVAHAEDMAYMWESRMSDNISEEDLLTRKRFLTMWSNFVKYLDPTPEEDDLLENIKWEKVAPNNLVYLNINDTLQMETNPKKYLEFEKIIEMYAIPPVVTY